MTWYIVLWCLVGIVINAIYDAEYRVVIMPVDILPFDTLLFALFIVVTSMLWPVLTFLLWRRKRLVAIEHVARKLTDG